MGGGVGERERREKGRRGRTYIKYDLANEVLVWEVLVNEVEVGDMTGDGEGAGDFVEAGVGREDGVKDLGWVRISRMYVAKMLCTHEHSNSRTPARG